MHLPADVVAEVVAKARGDRAAFAANDNKVPSPRGVADDLRFDLGFGNDRDGRPRKVHRVRLFPSDEERDEFVHRIGVEFLTDVTRGSLTVMEMCRRFDTMRPEDVEHAVQTLVPRPDTADHMDVDDSSEYDGSDGEVDDDVGGDSASDPAPATFDEAYPPVDDIRYPDWLFEVHVTIPVFRGKFPMFDPECCAIFNRSGRAVARAMKRALYAYLVGTLSAHYGILDQLEEASSLLELALWKARIGDDGRRRAGAGTRGRREACRAACGADVVVPRVLPYLFAGVCARTSSPTFARWGAVGAFEDGEGSFSSDDE